MVRQALDEADGVRHHHLAPFIDLDATGGCVESGEELVLHQYVGPGQGAQDGRLAGVGVAHQCCTVLLAAAARLYFTVGGHLDKILFELGHALAHEPPIRFKLGLAGAAGADAARLPLEMGPQLGQARQHVLDLCQLHLHPSLTGAGVVGEDVEDQFGAVDDRHLACIARFVGLRLHAVENLLDVAALGRREVVVEHDEGGLGLLHRPEQFLELALADQRARSRPVAALAHFSVDSAAGGLDQALELFEIAVAADAVTEAQGQIDAGEDHSFALLVQIVFDHRHGVGSRLRR